MELSHAHDRDDLRPGVCRRQMQRHQLVMQLNELWLQVLACHPVKANACVSAADAHTIRHLVMVLMTEDKADGKDLRALSMLKVLADIQALIAVTKRCFDNFLELVVLQSVKDVAVLDSVEGFLDPFWVKKEPDDDATTS